MLKLRRILRDNKDAGSLNSLLAPWGFVDDHTFLTKAGHVGVVYRLVGADYECLDQAQNGMGAVIAGFRGFRSGGRFLRPPFTHLARISPQTPLQRVGQLPQVKPPGPGTLDFALGSVRGGERLLHHDRGTTHGSGTMMLRLPSTGLGPEIEIME